MSKLQTATNDVAASLSLSVDAAAPILGDVLDALADVLISIDVAPIAPIENQES